MKGGKSYNDRIKSAEVRDKVLDTMLLVYNGKEDRLTQKQWELTLRMATTILPRLNEHSGPDGEPLALFDYVRSNDSHKQNKEPKEKN